MCTVCYNEDSAQSKPLLDFLLPPAGVILATLNWKEKVERNQPNRIARPCGGGSEAPGVSGYTGNDKLQQSFKFL